MIRVLANPPVRSALTAFVAAAIVLASAAAASAMPPFAQALGVNCSVCHTQVPALNAYGRYLQRTGYGTLDYRTLQRSTPVWIGEEVNYAHNSQDESSPRSEFGNVALHAAGALNADITFHIQQWIVQDGRAGGLDTAWLTDNGLFRRNGHLFVGKMPGTTASPLSQWFDIAAFVTPELTVGEHVYQNDGNRWGAKFGFVKNALDAEVGYFAGAGDLGDFGRYSPDVEKTFQWRLAHADPLQPLEYGIMGASGSFPLAEGGFDHYTSFTPYLQRDPVGGVPGIFAMYHMAYDGNAGQDEFGNELGAVRANAATIELYEPLGDKALIAFRKEFQNDGLGTQTQTGNIDLAYHVAPYLHLYLETAMAQNATPTWSYKVWWTMPLQKVRAPEAAATPVATAAPEPAASVQSVAPATPAPSVTVVASNWKFAPDAISLPLGRTTELRLTSSSGVHGLQSKELGIPLTVIEPGKTVTVKVTPSKAGTFVLHCAIVCGAGHENMVLTIVVTP